MTLYHRLTRDEILNEAKLLQKIGNEVHKRILRGLGERDREVAERLLLDLAVEIEKLDLVIDYV